MKTSIMVLGIGCAATMAIVLSTDNGIPGFNLFRSDSASIADIDTGPDNSEQTDELLTPLPDHAKSLTKVLPRQLFRRGTLTRTRRENRATAGTS